MAKKNILFINGVPDDEKVIIDKIEEDGTYKWWRSGSANLSNFLQNDLFDRSSVLFDTRSDQELPRQVIHAIFNQISDADTHKITLRKADDFYKAVSSQVPFLNAPSNIIKTTRDNIYKTLQGINKLHVPKTVKIQPKSPSEIYEIIKNEGFEFPVIFRQAGDHGGISTIRVDDDSEQFYQFALDGRDYYLTQFVDYADKDGVYVKYRLIVVDGEVFIRHVYSSKDWEVHSKNNLNDKVSHSYQNDIAKRFLKDIKPSIQPIVTEIYHRLGLDYFGIDCSIDDDMNILVFEINSSMNVFLKTENTTKNTMMFSKHIEKIRTALINMLSNKIQ